MSVTDELLANNAEYAADFTGPLPLPLAKHVADLDEDVRQSIARIRNSPFIPRKDSVRGFVFDIATGKLNEVQ